MTAPASTRTLYSDRDPFLVAWIENLIAAGHLPAGDVIEADVRELATSDCRPTTHLFAGVGGWPLALRMAGWPDELPVWTASLPCQPFSVAGKRRGAENDERNLWPSVRRLLAECRPPIAFGEQVSGPLGRRWLAGVRRDLEGLGYAVGAADLCAPSVGAPHKRQRLFWVAYADAHRRGEQDVYLRSREQKQAETRERGAFRWDIAERITCADGKPRRIESGLFPLAYGVPARMGRLRAYGNAVIPELAAEFVLASVDALAALDAPEAARGSRVREGREIPPASPGADSAGLAVDWLRDEDSISTEG